MRNLSYKNKFFKTLIGICTVFTLFLSTNTKILANESETPEIKNVLNESIGYIFIGDSRTVGMNDYLKIDDNDNIFTVAKVGKGYNWFLSEGYKEVEKIRKENDYKNWTYVFNLGVNDLWNISEYKYLINSLKNEANLVFVSINPVIESKVETVDNKTIEEFNKDISFKLDNCVDTYSYLNEIGFDSEDGLHYTKETYTDIYNYEVVEIRKMEIDSFYQKIDENILTYM